MIIAGTTVYVMTGSTIWEAGAVALVEPALNSIWFYTLHKTWVIFITQLNYKLGFLHQYIMLKILYQKKITIDS